LNIGTKIQSLRTGSGLTQEMLAEKLNVSRQSVSKWELKQTLPEIDKIVDMSRLFQVTTDELLLVNEDMFLKPNKNMLHLGSIYLIVKNFKKSIDFYEKLLSMRISTINPNIFAEFYFDGKNISIMNESNLPGHDTSGTGDNKFVLNFWIADLKSEYDRIKSLNIGTVTEITNAHTMYWFFNVYDPDNNKIEITGGYNEDRGGENMNTKECQSCVMQMTKPDDFGTETDGNTSTDYCCHCYQKGAFTWQAASLDEAVDGNIEFWEKEGNESDDEFRSRVKREFSKLKRWKTA